MKSIYTFVLAFVLALPCFGNPFHGTWELVSGEYKNEKGETKTHIDMQFKSIKVITENHFSFVTMTGDKFWASGAGKYRYTEKDYAENPVYNSFHSPAEAEYVFQYEMKKGQWHNTRIENGEVVEYEVWRKVK